MNHPEEFTKTTPNHIVKWVLKERQHSRSWTRWDCHQSKAAHCSCPAAYKTRSRSSHWAMSSYRSTARSQSFAWSGSDVWENIGGWPLRNSTRLSRGCCGGGGGGGWAWTCCSAWTVLFRVSMICIWSWKNCSGVKGGGIGIPVPWLFCPCCWPEPEPVLLVFTIWFEQKMYE